MKDVANEVKKRPGGRSARVRAAVVDAAFAELADVGYGAFSFERVAERAGVHKTTLYRRWQTRDDLILDAMLDRARVDFELADTGSLRTDLALLAKQVVAVLRDPAIEATVRAGASIADRQSPVAQASRRFWEVWFPLVTELVARARERRELAPDVDAQLLIEQIVGPIFFRLLLSDAPLDDAFAARLADSVAAGAAR